jgi:cytochrome bd-type quinol oxidase subunit 1
MDKRRLAYSLLLVGVLFVAVAHGIIATLFFGTGLSDVSLLVGAVALAGLAIVNA